MNKSKVIFNETEHTYMLDDKVLGGVTRIVAWMFPDTYGDIPQSVLDTAAERGSAIHEECQMYNEIGAEATTEEGKQYVQLLHDNNLAPLASEYLISDNKHIASSIDVVMNDYSIYDIKCTSSIHWDNVTLQVNIYKYLFEKQNPTLQVPSLGIIWLPKAQYGKAGVYPLQVLPTRYVKSAIKAYLRGDAPDVHRDRLFNKLPSAITKLKTAIAAGERRKKAIEAKTEKNKQLLLELMQRYCVKKWETDEMLVTYTAPTERQSVDTVRFKVEQPDLYNQYVKITPTKASIRIKLK